MSWWRAIGTPRSFRWSTSTGCWYNSGHGVSFRACPIIPNLVMCLQSLANTELQFQMAMRDQIIQRQNSAFSTLLQVLRLNGVDLSQALENGRRQVNWPEPFGLSSGLTIMVFRVLLWMIHYPYWWREVSQAQVAAQGYRICLRCWNLKHQSWVTQVKNTLAALSAWREIHPGSLMQRRRCYKWVQYLN